jgi:glycosyltransferase involved in cell wall biosynthesis
MAVYNGQEYLRAAVDSILAQTFTDFEFIIIDDGSSDQSLSILKEYENRDKRIRLISRPNKGLTKSLNEGVALAKGQYIARMDSDDVALTERFEKQVALLHAMPDLVAIGGAVQRIDARGTPMNGPDTPISHEEIEAELLMGKGGALVHPSLMMRRCAAAAVGGYRERFKTAQDLDLYLRLCEKGRLGNVSDTVLKYRVHNASVSGAKREQQDRDVYAILQDAYAARGKALPREIGRRRFDLTVEHYKKEFWAAWRRHDSTAARSSALRVIRKSPLRLEAWMLMVYAIVGNRHGKNPEFDGSKCY